MLGPTKAFGVPQGSSTTLLIAHSFIYLCGLPFPLICSLGLVQGMLDAAGGSSSSASKMAPELSIQEQEQQHPESEDTHECSVAEAPPRSPDRIGQHAKITCEKVEGDERLKFFSPECVSLALVWCHGGVFGFGISAMECSPIPKIPNGNTKMTFPISSSISRFL